MGNSLLSKTYQPSTWGPFTQQPFPVIRALAEWCPATLFFEITPSLLSTLTSAAHIQYAVDLGRLQQELKNVQKDLVGFQQKAAENLRKVEGKLSYLMEVVSGLERRSHDVEQRLTAEEDRGVARSQVLTFLLAREKELHEQCRVLEKALFKKNGGQKERLKNAVPCNGGAPTLKTAWN
ncbi:UNVERIFIED_CONTAM: hypothetical protein K2H54_037052 [Gekko kuhli]